LRAGVGSGPKCVVADSVPSPNGTLHSAKMYQKISAGSRQARSNMAG
jgi:hypothetical protein